MNEVYRRKIITALCVSFFASFTVFLSAPYHLYSTNIKEFSVPISEIYTYFLVAFFLSVIVLTSLMTVLKLSTHKKTVSILLAFSFLLWLQGHILVWDYGLLDGRDINWSEWGYYGLIDGGIWLLFVLFALVASDFVYSVVPTVSVVFILMQCVSISIHSPQLRELVPSQHAGSENGTVSKDIFEFSSEKNVIVLVLDTFQTDIFQEVVTENPEFENMFKGFIYYRNAVGGYPSTYPSIPLILTGHYYENELPIQDYIQESFQDSIPNILSKNGYRVDLAPAVPATVPCHKDVVANCTTLGRIAAGSLSNEAKREAASLFDLTLFRYLPHFAKKYVYNDQLWFMMHLIGDSRNSKEPQLPNWQDIEFTHQFVELADTGSLKPTFKLYHWRGIHPPIGANELCRYEEMPRTHDSLKRQAACALKLVQRFLHKLKEIGVYERSMIFIVSDHGYGSAVLLEGKILESRAAFAYSSGLPLILVKPFDAKKKKMKVLDTPVMLSDIPKTILATLDVAATVPGDSMLELGETTVRKRRYLHYKWEHKYWNKDYLPPIEEFTVSGFSWLEKSWRPARRLYLPKGTELRTNYIDIGTDKGRSFLSYWGWSGNEKWDGGLSVVWAVGDSASIYLSLPQTETKITMTARMFTHTLNNKQRVTVKLNNKPIGWWAIPNDSQMHIYRVEIPGQRGTNSPDAITFEFAQANRSARPDSQRVLAAAFDWIKFE